jgi:hypothetical protein
MRKTGAGTTPTVPVAGDRWNHTASSCEFHTDEDGETGFDCRISPQGKRILRAGGRFQEQGPQTSSLRD